VLTGQGLWAKTARRTMGIFDIAYLRLLPNITVMAPADKNDLEAMLEFSSTLESPSAIRYPRGAAFSRQDSVPFTPIKLGKAEVLRQGSDVAIIACGAMVQACLDAADILANINIHAAVVNARFVKPLDESLIVDLYHRHKALVTVEEGVVRGGFGSAVLEALETGGHIHNERKPVKCLGLPSEFITFDSRKSLLEKYGLSAQKIAESVKKVLQG